MRELNTYVIRIFIYLSMIVIMTLPAKGATYFVDDDNEAGPWMGTRDYPFKTISSGLDFAGEGDVICAAEGIYEETLAVPFNVTLKGGYETGWEARDPRNFMTIVDGGGNSTIVTITSGSIIDGLIVQNGAVGVQASSTGIMTVRNCLIRNLQGEDGDPGGAYPPKQGAAAYGIDVEYASLQIEDNVIENICAGAGGDGGIAEYSAYPGAPGGEAAGIRTLHTEGLTIENNVFSQIYGGAGGEGGWDGWNHSEDGGDGGRAYGIFCDQNIDSSLIVSNTISNIWSGSGGNSVWAHTTAGDGGAAGTAGGIYILNFSVENEFRDNRINGILGGNGGDGGDAGDYPGWGEPGFGGNGAGAYGIHLKFTSSSNSMNNLIRSITGGDGGDGGGGWSLSICGDGGDGGNGDGMYLGYSDSGEFQSCNNTIHNVSGGNGGNGGLSMQYPAKVPACENDIAAIKANSKNIRPTSKYLTPTPTPYQEPTPTYTPTGGPNCCGSGGDGGDARGIHRGYGMQEDEYLSNIISGIYGGNPGECFSPQTGPGYGFSSADASLTLEHNNLYDCSSALYHNCSPGTGAMNADPLWTSGPLGDHYLSSSASGQPADSPCINAGDTSALDRGLAQNYTVQTNHHFDEQTVDMGYHYYIKPPDNPVPASSAVTCILTAVLLSAAMLLRKGSAPWSNP